MTELAGPREFFGLRLREQLELRNSTKQNVMPITVRVSIGLGAINKQKIWAGKGRADGEAKSSRSFAWRRPIAAHGRNFRRALSNRPSAGVDAVFLEELRPLTTTGPSLTLIEKDLRVLPAPFVAAFSVLSNDNSQAHACAPVAIVASHP